MNKKQLKKKAEEVLDNYREKSYADLEKMIGETETSAGGTKGKDYYQAEVNAFYDNPEEKSDIRVAVAVDNGKLFSFVRPVCRDFIITKEGKLI